MYETIDTLWLTEAIVSKFMKVLRWSRTISHLFLRVCCTVDDIVHFMWMRECINNYPHPVCGIDRYQVKKKETHLYIIALLSIHFIHLSTSFFFQSQNSVYIFPHISPLRSLCPWPTFCPSWEYYCAGLEFRMSSFAKSTWFSIVLIHAQQKYLSKVRVFISFSVLERLQSFDSLGKVSIVSNRYTVL